MIIQNKHFSKVNITFQKEKLESESKQIKTRYQSKMAVVGYLTHSLHVTELLNPCLLIQDIFFVFSLAYESLANPLTW